MNYSSFLVSHLTGAPGTVDDVEVAIPLDMTFEWARIDAEAVGTLRLESASGGLIARGAVTVPVTLICQRCLSEFPNELAVSITQVFGNPDDDDSLPIAGDGRIDLEAAVLDEVGLSVPLTPICTTDCKGLCDTCGTDLNTEPCEGHAGDSTSPFASLESLFRTE